MVIHNASYRTPQRHYGPLLLDFMLILKLFRIWRKPPF